MANGKWIDGLTPAMPVADAARRVLDVRVKVVRHFLGLAIHEPEKDLEYVHRLRVGARRADAALQIFEICFPRRTYERLRQELRALRRAAGEARDWDVFLLELDARARRARRPSAGADFLLGYAVGERATAQQRLVEAPKQFSKQFEQFLRAPADAVREPDPPPAALQDLARPLLAGLLCEFSEAAQKDMNSFEHLHQVRIIGKRLRYAMEVFVCCFPSSFEKALYPAVEQMQEILGLANDSHVAAGRLTALCDQLRLTRPEQWRRFRAQLESIRRTHQRRLPIQRRRIQAWWKEWQASKVRADLVARLHGQVVSSS
jgi:CHAD domain-containing protein